MNLLNPSPVLLNPKKRWETSAISQGITYLLAKGGFAYLKKTQSALPYGLKYEAVTLTILESSFRQLQYLPAGFPGSPTKRIPGPIVTSTDFAYERLNQQLLNYDP